MKIIRVINGIIKVIIAISTLAGIAALISERFEKGNSHKPYGIYEKYIKRPLDAFLATGALIVFSPLLAVIALLVRIKLGSPVIFKQERPGRDEKIFQLLKFRSMTDERDENGELLPDELRLTAFSKAFRATSCDELPSLINIVKGDMAVVGPRPLLVEYLPRYNERQHHRHDVRPGLTGLAQVSGRNSISWEEKFEDDLRYVDGVSFLTDAKIVLKTVRAVLLKEGINSDTSSTMEPFMGNQKGVDEQQKCGTRNT